LLFAVFLVWQADFRWNRAINQLRSCCLYCVYLLIYEYTKIQSIFRK